MKTNKAFENSVMSCIMMTLIELYSSIVQKSEEPETDDEESSITVAFSKL